MNDSSAGNWLAIVQDRLHSWWEYAMRMLPNFLLALIVLVVFYLMGRLARRLSAGFVLRISRSASLSSLLSGILYTAIVIAGVMTALDIMELDKTVSSLIAGVGIIGLALGFAFQDLTANFISGAFMALKRPFEIGQTVETNGFLGTVEDMRLRSTTIRTSAGLYVIIPNKDIFQKPIINYSRTDERRVEIEFVVPSTTDAVFVEKTVRNALEKIRRKNGFAGIEFYFTAIENPNMRINVSFWTREKEPRPFMRVRHRAIIAIYIAFKKCGIYNVTAIPENTVTGDRRSTQ